MEELSADFPEDARIDYQQILGRFAADSIETLKSALADELPYIWLDAYRTMTHRVTNVIRFSCDSFEYVFDDYASLEATDRVQPGSSMEARLVAVSGTTIVKRAKRDDSRLKGWVGPTQAVYGTCWDKGHFIAHSIGGSVDRAEVNVFVQRRDLNRGWSAAGKRYVKMEKYCKLNPGTFCFSRPVYLDERAKPSFVEFGILLNNSTFWVDCFDNR